MSTANIIVGSGGKPTWSSEPEVGHTFLLWDTKMDKLLACHDGQLSFVSGAGATPHWHWAVAVRQG
jgi:hypothetical protein